MSYPLQTIAILGSTGSVGTQALEVIAQHPDRFRAGLLTAGSNYKLLIEQARRFVPQAVVICQDQYTQEVRKGLEDLPIEVFGGSMALNEQVQRPALDRVLTAMVGAAGLWPTIRAIEAGKTICLANKETLVVAGQIIMALAQKHGVQILPVDSEHSALFQALVGEAPESIHKLILTASGGPFRGYSKEQLKAVTVAQALRHPNWEMGAKITIDSASLMNKGLEVIEAHWLFRIPPERIEVVVHPQSIVHSVVEFVDGSLKAQLGTPDMRLPIQYALAYPARLGNDFPRFRFADYPSLTFEPVDRGAFRALDLAFSALAEGGDRSCVLNAAGEIANAAFREGLLPFTGMYDTLEHTLGALPNQPATDLDQLLESDHRARQTALHFIEKHASKPIAL